MMQERGVSVIIPWDILTTVTVVVSIVLAIQRDTMPNYPDRNVYARKDMKKRVVAMEMERFVCVRVAPRVRHADTLGMALAIAIPPPVM
jgi:hypothetical protein